MLGGAGTDESAFLSATGLDNSDKGPGYYYSSQSMRGPAQRYSRPEPAEAGNGGVEPIRTSVRRRMRTSAEISSTTWYLSALLGCSENIVSMCF